ncbi:hypothetical protein RJT34_13157 [Clitoria ternatea]|uniref:non-specific serine/threonine protein kinase n=1 Tax=Clitoria ternatea TaxID=43366 RepID=A0AAN9JR21_CLITE
MTSPSTIFSLLFFFFLLLPPTTLSQTTTTTFIFPSFTLRNITLLGDSFLRNGTVGLTRATPVPASSSGSLLFNTPFTTLHSSTFSFSSSFSFSISNSTSTFSTSSLSLFLNSSHHSLSLLFLTNPNQLSLNLNNNPIQSTDPTLHAVHLNTGNLFTSWVDYNGTNNPRKLSVFLNYSNSKPQNPILTLDFDLSQYFKDNFHVGFSGSTLGSTDLLQISSWGFEFESFQEEPSFNHSNPNNISRNPLSVDFDDTVPAKDSNVVGKNRVKWFAIGVAIAGPALFLLMLLVLGYVSFTKWRGGVRKQRGKCFGTSVVAACCPKEFGYKELKLATKGFHVSRIIGKGSFGTVYKALFESSGTIAAVKRSRQYSHDEGKAEFLAELSIIAGLRHKNLVQLQGWCAEKGELLLVYEFMPNGSLDKMLYQESECDGSGGNVVLSWSHRLNIAVGLASVLSYLHQECEQRVIHRDIKTGNILLDGNLNPRLGDFGLAKLMDHDKSPVSTLTAGTMGYLAPEYLQCGMATEKTDVFSYGVVVLEVACGRRPIEREGQKMVNLVDWVWGLHSEGRIIEAADGRLKGEFQEEEMRKLLLLGLGCANPDSAQRPSMRRVLQILNNENVTLVVPRVKPTLTFSSGLPLSLDEIVSDAEDEFKPGQFMCEIKID